MSNFVNASFMKKSFMQHLLFIFLTQFLLSLSILHAQSFTQITEGDIVNDGGQSRYASWADYDNDGNLDLFVSNVKLGANASDTPPYNILYRNNGDGTFTKITESILANDAFSSRRSTWGDYDNDGNLDLFVANGSCCLNENNLLYRNNGDGTFTKNIQGDIVNDRGYSNGAIWGDYNGDGNLDLFVANLNGGVDPGNYLYQNNGDGTFTKITDGDIVNTELNVDFSSDAGWADYDNDGDLDLFVANGNAKNNRLYQNNGNGTFTKITEGDIVNDSGDSYGHSWGDYDNDGDLDLFVANWYVNYDSNSPDPPKPAKNFLYQNNGDGTFTKITEGDIVNDRGPSHDANWVDIDNDGDLDLYVSNTHIDGNTNHENNFLYENNGDGTFTKITEGAIVNDAVYSVSSSWGDYDNDGDIDLFISNEEGNNLLYKNDLYSNNGNINKAKNNNRWIKIKLSGNISNASAIGAKVRVKATINGNSYWQMREITASRQTTLNAAFGLGDAEIIESIIVEWPSGIVDQFTNVDVNKFMTITESNSTTSVDEKKHNNPTTFALEQNFPNPFNPTTTIRYELKESRRVKLQIFNENGQFIRTLADAEKSPGNYSIVWDARDNNNNVVASGVYFYRLTAGNQTQSKQMILMK